MLVRFDHVASVIVNASHSGVRPHPAHHSGVDNVFCVDKVEDSGLKLFGNDCEHSPVGEAVIELAMVKRWTPRQGKSGCNLGLAVADYHPFKSLVTTWNRRSGRVFQSHCQPQAGLNLPRFAIVCARSDFVNVL